MGKSLYFTDLTEVTKKSELAFDGEILHVYKDDIELPNGSMSTREVIRHIGAVGIVAVDDDGCVIIEKQFRYPLARVVTEIPAGKLDSKTEDRLEAAKRELLEETGVVADEWIELGNYVPAAAYCDEVITLYIAKGLHVEEQDLDEDEFLNIERIPLTKLVEDVLEDRILDGKTQVAILRAAKALGKL